MGFLDWLGSGSQKRAVQRIMVKVLNHKQLLETTQRNGREETRSPVVLEARVAPWDGRRPVPEESFFTTTRDITLSGLSIVASAPLPAGAELAISLFVEEEYHHLLAVVRHATRLGPESCLIGLEAIRPIPSSHELSVRPPVHAECR